MNVQILITITGPYQADLVKVLSHKTHALGGKWLNSKISHIEGYMAGLIKVELKPEKVDALLKDFKALNIEVGSRELKHLPKLKTKHFNLSIDTKDRAGLVRDISEVLSQNSINVESMECNRVNVSGISEVIFTSHFQITVSDAFDKEALISALQELPDDLLIDIDEP